MATEMDTAPKDGMAKRLTIAMNAADLNIRFEFTTNLPPEPRASQGIRLSRLCQCIFAAKVRIGHPAGSFRPAGRGLEIGKIVHIAGVQLMAPQTIAIARAADCFLMVFSVCK